MWWEPSSPGTDREVFEWLEGAKERFSSDDRQQGQVWGVGSYIAPDGLRPMVLLDEKMLEEGPSPVPRLLSQRLLPQNVRQQLSGWEFPDRTVYLAVTEPKSLGNVGSIAISTGAVLRCTATGKQGTIGPAVEGSDAAGRPFTGVLTAGHVLPNGQNSAVDVVQERRWRQPQRHHVGSVLHHIDPNGRRKPDYDVAVVKLNTNTYLTGATVPSVATIQSPISRPVLCNMYGGFSGTFAQAGIVGTLTSFGSPSERLWKNCWLLTPSSVAQVGDSGSLVSVRDTAEGLGLLVGGSRAANADWFLCWYAHDLSCIQREVLNPLNVNIK